MRNAIMVLVLAMVLCGIPVLILSSNSIFGVERTCQPAYRVVSDDGLKISVAGTWELSFDVAIIGCGEDLADISRPGMEIVSEAVKKSLAEAAMPNLGLVRNRAFRKELTRVINEKLEKEIISDVYFGCFSMSEPLYMRSNP